MLTLLLIYAAGALTVLNPCVLPVLPLVLGTTLHAHKFGLLAFILGLVGAFTAVGMLLAGVGMSLGISPSSVRTTAASAMLILGLIMVVGNLSTQFSSVMLRVIQPIMPKCGPQEHATHGNQFWRQFGAGALAGLIWSPCTGALIGATYALAAQQEHIAQASLQFSIFALGAATPLVLFGTVLRGALRTHIATLSHYAHISKLLMGGIFIVMGASVLMGFDKVLETMLLRNLPSWWLDLSTSL